MNNDLIERYLYAVAVKYDLDLAVESAERGKSGSAFHIDGYLDHNTAVLKGTDPLILGSFYQARYQIRSDKRQR